MLYFPLTWKRILLILLALIVVVAGGGLAWLSARKPAQAVPSTRKVEMSPARLARGKGWVFPAELGLPGTA